MAKKAGFLGSGIMAPMSLSEGRGIALTRAEEDVEQCIRLILSTRPGERVMRPDFGCAVHNYVFAPNNSTTRQRIRDAVYDALDRHEPRITDLNVDVTEDAKLVDRLNVKIRYKIRTVNTVFNMVYPFYLQGS